MTEPKPSKRLMVMTTSPLFLSWFIRPQVRLLRENGFELHAVSSPGALLDQWGAEMNVPVYGIPMKRHISPWADAAAIPRIWRLMRRIRPDIVHLHTPKAGLLGAVAGALAGVKPRVYTIHGLPLITRTGWTRHVLAAAERLTCAAATDVLCVSRSLRDNVAGLGILAPERMQVLGDGGCAGVDLRRYSPTSPALADPAVTRRAFGCPPGATVLAYIGRIVKDKGLADLARAWVRLRETFPALHLLLCGEFEDQDPLDPEIVRSLREDPRVHFSGRYLQDMPSVYAAIDLCVLPSYREGLPTVPLECSAMQKPVVATRIPGCVESVQDGVTGLLVEPRNPDELHDAIARLLSDPALRNRMGRRGREFVASRFSEERVFDLILAEYTRLLDGNGREGALAGVPGPEAKVGV